MNKQAKSRKPLIIGIVAAVLILAVLLVLLLTQCTPGGGSGASGKDTSAQTVGYLGEAEHYDLYWNLDRALYDGKSEAGMSSRKAESDGYFHVRFFKDGEIIELKVADRKTVNAIEVNDLMGLEFDSNGIVVNVISLDDMPLQQVGWKFYVQSIGGKLLKLNSAKTFDGMELLCEMLDDTGIYDMTGAEGEVGKRITPIATDRVIAIANLAGELTHVFIYDRSEYMQSFEGECQHCKETVTWKLWNKADTLPTDTGHYQLTADITLKKQQAILEDGKVCLDLNGFAVDGASNARVYSLHNVGANLALMDTSEEKTGVLRGHSESSPQGGVVWVRYGAFYMYGGTLDGSDMTSVLNGTVVQVPKGSYFYMYDGTIIGGTSMYTYNAEKNSYGNGLGGAVAVSGKFVMHDGLITGGKAVSAVSAWNTDGTPKTYQRGIGGNIYVASGAEFEMKGGTIQNGVAGHSGGNVYLDGTATMVMDGGTIAGGAVTGKGRNGGNVFVTSKATFTMNGGSINWGTSYNCAANLYFNGTVNMNGGYIGCGVIRDWATNEVKAANNTTNIYQVNGTMTMYGGVIDGGFSIIDTSATDQNYATLILGGMPVISGREELEYEDLVLVNGGSGVRVIVATMVNGSKVGVNATTGIFTKPTSEANKQYFYSTIDEAEVHYLDGCLALGRWGCVCGSEEHFGACDGTQLFWAPINSGTIPNTTGNYYLCKDVTISSQCSVTENADVKLDLNGYTLTGPNNKRALTTFTEGSKLTVTDSSEGKTGVVKSRGMGDTQGNAVWVRYGSFDFYGGTLDGSGYTLHTNWAAGKDGIFGTEDDTNSGRDGGTVAMSSGTTFNMYGGTIIGNKAIAYTAEKTVTEGEGEKAVTKTVTKTLNSSNGASLAVGSKCVFNMYDGVIRDGTSDSKGGNIYCSGTAVLNLYGGVVSGGRSGMFNEDGTLVTYEDASGKTKVKSAGWGGNLDINDSAVVNISGVVITGGVSGGNGGNIRVGNAKATLNMSTGVVSNGQSTTDQGGNIFISGTANLTGGTVSGGKAANGGNIGVNSSKDVTLQGVTVTGGVATGKGGNIRMSTTNTVGSLIIAEGTTVTGGTAKTGGNLSVEINNANKNDPVAVVNITGGILEKGLAKGDMGGNIYAASGVTMNISGGTITNGISVVQTSGGKGGNLYINGANVTVSGGIVSNGQAGSLDEDGETVVFGTNDSTKRGWGGNVSIKAGSLHITGEAQFLGGTAGRNGGSIHVEGGSLSMSGGTVSGGLSTADQGGNIWMGSKTTLNVTGGVIKDGTTAKNGGNIHCNANVGVLLDNVTISGGSAYGSKSYRNANVNLAASEDITIGSVNIAGYVQIASSVKLTGKPVIKGGSTNLYLGGNDINIEGLDAGTDVRKVGITDGSAGIFTGVAKQGEEGYFFSDDPEKVVGFVNGKLVLEEGRLGMGRYRCLCGKTEDYEGEHDLGCDEQIRFWAAWTATDSLPTEHGNWYLTADEISFSTQFVMEEGAEIAIDLNGCIVTDKDNRMLTTSKNNSSGNVTLWITDTAGGGVLKVTDGAYNGQGMILWLDTSSTLNIIAGTLDASQAGTSGSKNSNGAAIYVAGGSSLNLYGGTILGGTATMGGAVYVSAGTTFNMRGGTVSGGTAMFDMYTSTAKDKNGNEYTVYNTADSGKGGAIYVAGTLNLYDGTITGGKAIYGQVQNGVDDNGEPTYGTAGGYGGNIYVTGTLNMYGGEITGGKVENEGRGGNIYLGSGSNATITGGTVSDGQAGTEVVDPETQAVSYLRGWGGNIMIKGGSLMLGGTASVTGGWANNNGGSINVESGSMTMEGGSVSGGTTQDRGGNIFVAKGQTLTVTGGTITGGTAGGTITNGVSQNNKGGGNIATNEGAAVSLSNVTINDPHVDNRQLYRANMEINTKVTLTIGDGTTISGGVGLVGSDVTLEMSGKVIIDGGDSCASNLSLKGNTITLGEMKADSSVGITQTSEGAFTTASDTDYSAYFFADDATKGIAYVARTNYKNSSKASANKDDKRLWLGHYDCLCAGAGENGACVGAAGGCTESKVLWMPWTATDMLPTVNGNWYLTENIDLLSQVKNENANQTIRIDLNGKTVRNAQKEDNTASANMRMYWLAAGKIDITITDGVGTGKMFNNSKYDQGAFFWINSTNGTVTLLAGELDASGYTTRGQAGTGGVAISINGTGRFVMYGGLLKAGSGTYGLAVNSTGTFEMHGGEIVGGEAKYQFYTQKNESTGGQGGAIYSTGTMLMTGGKISGGTALEATSTDGTTGGGQGDNVYVASTGTLTMSGGEIVGGVDVSDAKTVSVSGTAIIDRGDATNTTYSLQLGSKELTVGTLTSGASIKISADEGAFTNTGRVEVDLSYFSADSDAQGISLYNGQLHLGKYGCICGSTSANTADHKHYMDGDTLVGCDGTKVAWTPWTSTTTLPTTTGRYYLTDNVVLPAQASLVANADVVLDLNGYKVTPAQKDDKDVSMRMISIHNSGAKFTLTDNYVVPAEDSADYDANRTGGEIIGSATKSDQGLVVWCRWDGAFTEGTTFVMLGGKLSGAEGSINNSHGGVVRVGNNGKFYMLDGTISNGTAKNGGNVDVDVTGRMIMLGGEIKDGHASNGSGIRAFGALELRGGKVEDTVLAFNWNQSSASVTMSGDVDVEHIFLNKGKDQTEVDIATIVVPTITIEGQLTGTTVTKITTYSALDHYIATTTVEANAAHFSTDYEGKAIHYIDGKLYLGKYHCLCGGNGNTDTTSGGICVGATEGCDSVLRVWTATSSLPSTTGNYYLSKNVTLTGNGPTIKTTQNIVLDLNGYNVINKMTAGGAGRIYSTSGAAGNTVKLSFTNTYTGTDAARTGDFILDDSARPEGEGGDQGRVVWMAGGNTTVKLYKVDIDLRNSKTAGTERHEGAAFEVGTNRRLELYNLNIMGGTLGDSSVIEIINTNAKVLLHNTTISGHTDGVLVNTTDEDSGVTLSGNSYVGGNAGYDIKLVSGAQPVTLAEGYTGSVDPETNAVLHVTGITVSGTTPVDAVLSADGTALTYGVKDLFETDDDKVLGLFDGKLQAYAAGTHIHCVCAGNLGTRANGYVYDVPGTEDDHVCEDILYTAISGNVAGGAITTGGNWYLSDDVNVTGNHYQMKGMSVNLCLNGKNWNGLKDKRAIALFEGENYLSVTTCQEDTLDANGIPTNNRIVASGAGDQGCGVWVRSGVFNLYAGHVDGSNFTTTKTGANINITKNTVAGVMNMYGGSVFGGTAKNGGNIQVNTDGTLNMYGGKIYNGNATEYGGNVGVNGVFNMYGGLITNGKVGGNLLTETANVGFDGAAARLNISGGEITGGIAAYTAGAILTVSGDARLTNPDDGNADTTSDGFYRVIITENGETGTPMLSMVIGELSQNATVRVTNKKGTATDAPYVGQFATAMDGYTITSDDMSKITVWWHGGKTVSNAHEMVLVNNTICFQEK